MTEQEVEPEVVDAGQQLSQWEFLDRVPTSDDVMRLLATLDPVWGVDTIAYAEHVIALPQKKKIKVPHPDRPDVKIDREVQAMTLYMSVAGRIKMIEQAAYDNDWAVSFEPEPVTPTGIPGVLQLADWIVYREYVVIETVTHSGGERLGRKPGTAWVPGADARRQAAKSNPWEKVETAARGRAIAAWGFGVLPGSGVASVEEILGATQNQQALDAQGSSGAPGAPRRSRDDLLQEAHSLSEEVRLLRGFTDEEQMDKIGEYLSGSLGIKSVYDEEAHAVDWQKVKDGQISLLVQTLTQTVQRLRAQDEPV